MKKELEKIALQLQAWAKKYKKNYVDMSIVNNAVMTSIDINDKDYEKLNFYIKGDKE